MKEEMRISKLVTTFGPGSIFTSSDGGSYMVMSPHFWHETDPIFERRLEKKLGVDHFVSPKQSWNRKENRYMGIAVRRFPVVQVCPECYLLTTSYYCEECSTEERMIYTRPPRLIAACEDGHIQDFPWKIWARCDCDDGKERLRLQPITGSGTRNSDLEVKCDRCGNSNDLRGTLGPIKIGKDKYYKCMGNRPWLGLKKEGCDKILRGLMRGSSNVYFPDTESAISIPPFTEKAYREIEKHKGPLSNFYEDGNLTDDIIKGFFKDYIERDNYDVSDIRQAIEEYFGYSAPSSLKYEEWKVLVKGWELREKEQFQSTEIKIGEKLDRFFDQIVKVDKLREVLALKGFYRVKPGRLDEESTDIIIDNWEGKRNLVEFGPIPKDKRDLKWLPGVEHLGEGIFFRFDSERLNRWENDEKVKKRTENIFTQADDYLNKKVEPEPRTILIHSFSHQMLKLIALDCGYPIASLKERLYISSDEEEHQMSGVLIYTSSPDSEGTLGGLISQAKKETLKQRIGDLKNVVSVCSQDPLCKTHDPSKTGDAWGASCHSCLQVPETSCEGLQNKLLDRLFLFDRESKLGYFHEYFD